MALKNVFNAMKREGYVVKPLDLYLLSLNSHDDDRAINVNAPSAVGSCRRARYYARTGEQSDANSVDARTRRIFDNGTHTHLRLQKYLADAGILIMDEIPVFNKFYNIQGHTDGLIHISDTEDAILEIKSINSKGFTELKSPKPEHRMQGLVYVYCVESHRKELRFKYPNENSFKNSSPIRKVAYKSMYQHLQSGSKFTRQQKIMFQVSMHLKMDDVLWHLTKPVTKCIFLYENKDNQELKEFCVSTEDAQSKRIVEEILSDYNYLNKCVENRDLPPREGRSKSDNYCRWCNYKSLCWVV